MILFSWPVDLIVDDFTLPGHWRNTVFIFSIDFITSFGQQYRILLLFFFFAVFCLFAEISFCWAESTRQTQPDLFIQTTTRILAITGKPIRTDARS